MDATVVQLPLVPFCAKIRQLWDQHCQPALSVIQTNRMAKNCTSLQHCQKIVLNRIKACQWHYISVRDNMWCQLLCVIREDAISPNSTWLVTSRLDTTRLVRRVEPMHFDCVELVEHHGSTRSSRRARHVERVVSCRDEPCEFWAIWVKISVNVITASSYTSSPY